MSVEEILSICRQLPAVTQDIKWEDHLCFHVGDKMFLVTCPDQVPSSASFKVADEDFEETAAREGFKPAPYMARYKWVHLDDIRRLTPQQWQDCIAVSYRLVAAKLTKKTRQQLGLPN